MELIKYRREVIGYRKRNVALNKAFKSILQNFESCRSYIGKNIPTYARICNEINNSSQQTLT